VSLSSRNSSSESGTLLFVAVVGFFAWNWLKYVSDVNRELLSKLPSGIQANSIQPIRAAIPGSLDPMPVVTEEIFY